MKVCVNAWQAAASVFGTVTEIAAEGFGIVLRVAVNALREEGEKNKKKIKRHRGKSRYKGKRMKKWRK